MPLQKQPVAINFSQGLDQKTDPFQVAPGKFLSLENSIFDKAGLLQKRNGYGKLTSLPDTTYSSLTTFNDNLTAIGSSLSAYSKSSMSWVNKGTLQPLQLETLSLIRSSTNQTQCDAAVAANGLVCTVYTDVGSSTVYKYAVADVNTGQNIVAPTVIASASESPRVFLLSNYFVVLYSQGANLKYVAVPINNPTSPIAATTVVTNYAAGMAQLAFDGVVANNNLYIAYNATDGGGAIRMSYLNSFLARQTAATGVSVAAAKSADMMSVCADNSTNSPVIWVSFYLTAGTTGYVLARDGSLNAILAATQYIAAGTVLNVASAAKSGSVTLLYEVSTSYSFGGATNLVTYRTCTQAGALGTATIVLRSIGLASKAFIRNSVIYFLGVYSSSYQPTYFLTDISGHIAAKLAYQNGGGYLTKGLPSVSFSDDIAQVPYLIKDLITSVNKDTNVTSGTQIAGIYAQTGVSLAILTFGTDRFSTAEIGGNLNISGGFLWAYDGYLPVEHGFHLYPDSVNVTTSGAGGSITAQDYYYVATYEWADNQGNIFRSAASIPVKQTTVGATSTNTIKVPTLRLTYKTANPIKVVVYRWSTAQQAYYQVTSLSAPTLNDTTVDSVTITDTAADATILGNSLLYTTGGVVENVGPPATNAMTLYKSRLFLIDAEDPNLLWFSKQVIENAPVEMSDLFTLYVAPTISAQGNTGELKALSAMDDKLILFKKSAIYYLVGVGPDNTGSNNDFSDPVFISSTVGCSNQNSIVFIPSGLMFESDKGIWLLGRDLSTRYIGAEVETLTKDATVLSAVNIPSSNQVRFTLSTGVTLMYDYFFQQWGTFTHVPAISSTLYEGVHTFINDLGGAYQETPGLYLDGSNPVLMKLTTSWFNLAGLQGFIRAYNFYLLGTYITPHKLSVQIAYDYNASPTQISLITPDNYNPNYGDDPLYGSSSYSTVYGGNGSLEQWRVFFAQQKCQAFQLTIEEVYDGTFGVQAGAGFTLSGLNLVVGLKKGYSTIRAARSVG